LKAIKTKNEHILNLSHLSKQPYISKQQKHSQEESNPDFPTNTRPFGHAQHSVHGSAETDAGAVEGFVHGIRLFVEKSILVRLMFLMLELRFAGWNGVDKYQIG
jgi:hypothetical protein